MLDYKDDQEVGEPEDDDDHVKEILKNIRDGRDHASKWRSIAETCYDFFAGHQWSEEDQRILSEQNRSPIVFNRIPRTINAVSGLELQNRQEVRYIPREQGDVIKSELLTGAAKWVRDNCDAEDEESESFQDTLICGMGWTETRLDYETNPDGIVIVDRVDPLEMGWDPGAKKRNLDDARFLFRDKLMSKKEFRETWPDVELESDTSWVGTSDDPHDADDAKFYINDQSHQISKKNYVKVTQYQWWERETFYRVESELGNIKELSTAKFGKVKDYIKASNLRYVKQTRRAYKQAFIFGRQILEDGPAPCNGFTFRSITGSRDRNNGYWFGLVWLMIDPQMWANKWLSQILHIVNTGAKNGLMAEEGAVKNQAKLEEDWAKPGSVVTFAQGALSGGKVQQKEAPRYPEGIDRLLQYAMQSINDIPGVNLEMLGLVNKDQGVRLEQGRKDAGVTILAVFFDSLRRYRKEQGRVLANFIVDYISDGRLIKVAGKDMAQYVPLLKKDLDFEYDIVVDDAPTSPNMKEKVFGVISNLLPTALQAGIPIPPDILDYAPLPETLIQKWKSMIKNSEENPLKKKLKELEATIVELQAGKLQSEITLNEAKAQQSVAIAKDEGAQAMNKLGLDKAHNDIKIQTMMQEQHRKDTEMMMNQNRKDIELEAQIVRDSIIKGNKDRDESRTEI